MAPKAYINISYENDIQVEIENYITIDNLITISTLKAMEDIISKSTNEKALKREYYEITKEIFGCRIVSDVKKIAQNEAYINKIVDRMVDATKMVRLFGDKLNKRTVLHLIDGIKYLYHHYPFDFIFKRGSLWEPEEEVNTLM